MSWWEVPVSISPKDINNYARAIHSVATNRDKVLWIAEDGTVRVTHKNPSCFQSIILSWGSYTQVNQEGLRRLETSLENRVHLLTAAKKQELIQDLSAILQRSGLPGADLGKIAGPVDRKQAEFVITRVLGRPTNNHPRYYVSAIFSMVKDLPDKAELYNEFFRRFVEQVLEKTGGSLNPDELNKAIEDIIIDFAAELHEREHELVPPHFGRPAYSAGPAPHRDSP